MRRTVESAGRLTPRLTPKRHKPRRGLSAACVLAAAMAVHCRCNHVQQASPAPGVQAVPTVRVLLTASPVEEVRVGTTGGYWLKGDGQVLAQSQEAMPAVSVRRQDAGWRVGSLTTDARELLLVPTGDQQVRLGEVTYRGCLRLLPADSRRLVVINHVDLESYLAGVLSKELYPAWDSATYGAVAVAARTFALYHMTTFGARNDYDLGDTQASQVYGGVPGETPRSWDAAHSTYGTVLSYGEVGAERIFMAQYSACCGGHVNGAYVIRNAQRIPPLEGCQQCDDCQACTRFRWDPVRIAKPDIYRAIVARYPAAGEIGALSGIQVASTTPHGRAVWVDAVGPGGKKVRLRAEDVRLALIFDGPPAAKKLYSMNCQMVDRGREIEFRDGRGFGHGVGLCQWGAQGKARLGWTAEQILAFYYPGAKLYRVY
jgi:stage II sporulation protein D